METEPQHPKRGTSCAAFAPARTNN